MSVFFSGNLSSAPLVKSDYVSKKRALLKNIRRQILSGKWNEVIVKLSNLKGCCGDLSYLSELCPLMERIYSGRQSFFMKQNRLDKNFWMMLLAFNKKNCPKKEMLLRRIFLRKDPYVYRSYIQRYSRDKIVSSLIDKEVLLFLRKKYSLMDPFLEIRLSPYRNNDMLRKIESYVRNHELLWTDWMFLKQHNISSEKILEKAFRDVFRFLKLEKYDNLFYIVSFLKKNALKKDIRMNRLKKEYALYFKKKLNVVKAGIEGVFLLGVASILEDEQKSKIKMFLDYINYVEKRDEKDYRLGIELLLCTLDEMPKKKIGSLGPVIEKIMNLSVARKTKMIHMVYPILPKLDEMLFSFSIQLYKKASDSVYLKKKGHTLLRILYERKNIPEPKVTYFFMIERLMNRKGD